jgi:hypothetical protein
MDFLSLIVITCVLNQLKSHWLLSNALQFDITMCLKLKEEIINPFAPVSLIDDDFGIAFELSLFASNIRREVSCVLDYFIFLKRKIEKRKTHNMFLMLYPNFKSLCLVFFLLVERKV